MGNAPSGPVPVIIMGLGGIGQEIVRAALASEELSVVGAVDTHPALAGKRVGELMDVASEVRVVAALEHAVRRGRRAVVLHATGSALPQVMDQILAAVGLGHSVVSTCEELAFPYLRHPDLAEKLDRAARRSGVAVLGTGVNPGFVLDRLVATAGQAVGPVRHVLATRTVDVRTRREALQRKVGAGLTEEAFQALAEQDGVGHVGLLESAALCAMGLGMDCDDFEETLLPVLAEEDIPGGAFLVQKGRVAGIHQTAVGLEEGRERVRLELTLAAGVSPSIDRIVLTSDAPLTLEIPGGVPGDRATAYLVVHAAPRLTAAEAGLMTVLDLPAGR